MQVPYHFGILLTHRFWISKAWRPQRSLEAARGCQRPLKIKKIVFITFFSKVQCFGMLREKKICPYKGIKAFLGHFSFVDHTEQLFKWTTSSCRSRSIPASSLPLRCNNRHPHWITRAVTMDHKEDWNHALGLTLLTPCLVVLILFYIKSKEFPA